MTPTHRRRWLFPLVGLLGIAACGDSGGAAPVPDTTDTTEDPADVPAAEPDLPPDVLPDTGPDPVPPAEDMARDLLHAALSFDVSAKTGSATLRVAPSDATGLSFDVAGLEVLSVTTTDGADLAWAVTDGRLDIGVPASDTPPEVAISWTFGEVPAGVFEGYMSSGSTLLWPYWCGNLFPCHPDPNDGFTLALDVLAPDGQVAVHPAQVDVELPAYAVAFAVGDYQYVSLGTTTAGTEVGYWTLPGTADTAASGTARLVDILDWLEQTLGPYSFGSPVGPVAVDWGFALGGIEHHPAWHVSTYAMGNESVHAHEAAHGWYGTGIRLACWEDLVLSEGTAEYLMVRATAAIGDEEAAQKLLDNIHYQLSLQISLGADHVAWPDSCMEIDVLAELFSKIPYYKGALFYEAVADEIGAEALDAVLGTFYQAHANQPALMADMLDLISAETGFDPEPLAEAWLRGLGIPEQDD